MSKPLKIRCEKYCPDYPCNKTSCDRKPMFKQGGTWKMVEPYIADKLTTKIKKEIWYNSWNTRINNI